MKVLGKMLAFEATLAGSLWLLGKVAPELKRQAEEKAKSTLQDAIANVTADTETTS
jgi:hypothetical protein